MRRHLTKEDIQMANDKTSKSIATREMQIKTMMSYYYTPIGRTKVKIIPRPNASENTEKLHLSTLLIEM